MENSTSKKEIRRKLGNLLIEPFKQVKFGIYMFVITLSFIFICGILLVNSFYEQYSHVMSIFNVVDPHLRWEFITDEVFYANLTQMVIVFLVFMFVLFSTIIKLTHRIYGPLVSIRRFLGELESGNYNARVRIRKNDELQDLANQLNKVAEALQKRHQR